MSDPHPPRMPRAPAPAEPPQADLEPASAPAHDLVIRPARVTDLAAVEWIENASFGDPWPRRALEAELHQDALRWPLVAEREGKVVGYLMAWRVAGEFHILNLAVSPSARRRGAATRLLGRLLADAAAQGVGLLTLEVRPSNSAARAFYRRHGFVDVGRRTRYYRDTGEDAIVMSLTIPVAGRSG